MALLLFEGFEDSFATNRSSSYYNLVSVSSGYGRLGSIGALVGDSANGRIGFPFTMSGDTLICGIAVNIRSYGLGYDMLSGTNFPVVEQGTASNKLRVIVNGYTTAEFTFPYLEYNHFEMKVVYSATVGTITVNVNGAEVLAETGLNTGTAPTTGNMDLAGTGTGDIDNMYVDDIYLCDGSGTEHNDFLGDCRVVPLYPDGNGNSSGMVGSDADQTDNYALVNEVTTTETSPSTATYVGSGTEGDKDTYTVDDLVASPTVLAVMTTLYAAKTDTGTKLIRSILRSGTTDYPGATVAPATTYAPIDDLWIEDPDTAAAWTVSGVNGMQIGQEARDS